MKEIIIISTGQIKAEHVCVDRWRDEGKSFIKLSLKVKKDEVH